MFKKTLVRVSIRVVRPDLALKNGDPERIRTPSAG
jgi:hypothetical protein